MSEPEPEDHRESRRSRPAWWPRAAGAALVVVGLALRFATDGGALPITGWCLAMLGLAFALFGGSPGDVIPGDLEPTAPGPARSRHRGPLALGALGVIVALAGIGQVTATALAAERATDAWWLVVAGTVLGIVAVAWGARRDERPRPMRVDAPRRLSTRLAITIGVTLALAVQAAIPATYYVSGDRFDERFAWRMFSAVRVYRCQVSALDLRRGRASPVDLPSSVHVAWINTMRRGREGVLQRYLTWRCETADGLGGARVVNRCVSPEGERVPDQIREIDCASGEIVSVETEP